MEVQNEEYKINVYCDEDVENPREWEHVGTMVCWHKYYALGDKNNYADSEKFIESDEAKKAYVMLPVYLYDDSMQKLSNSPFVGRAVHAEQDIGQVGYIYVIKEKVKELTGMEPTEANKPAVTEMLKAETELYSSYIEGNCYGYIIQDMTGDTLDQCGGFFGDDMGDILRQMQKQAGSEYEPLFSKMRGYAKTLNSVMQKGMENYAEQN